MFEWGANYNGRHLIFHRATTSKELANNLLLTHRLCHSNVWLHTTLIHGFTPSDWMYELYAMFTRETDASTSAGKDLIEKSRGSQMTHKRIDTPNTQTICTQLHYTQLHYTLDCIALLKMTRTNYCVCTHAREVQRRKAIKTYNNQMGGDILSGYTDYVTTK